MSFFVFDLDETLAEVYPLHYFIEPAPAAHVYREFVKGVAAAEDARVPLGLLRPGILAVMERLLTLQRRGILLGVLIYSNNGHLPTLKFIRDVIHAHLGIRKPLILECIHWDHPDRTDSPVREDKTWDSLRGILERYSPAIPPDRVYFVDDLEHPDLMEALGEQYLHVPPYEYHASFDRLVALMEDAAGVPFSAAERSELRRRSGPRNHGVPPPVDALFQASMDEAIRPLERLRSGGHRRARRLTQRHRLKRAFK